MPALDREFFARPARVVARDVIGMTLVREDASGTLCGRIVETEAYEGGTDPGSHAFRGPTPRTQVMFGPAGRLYVYRSYGVHWCVNVVTDNEGVAGAVLLRALQPLAGIDVMRARRGREPLADVCSGPGKLCQAFDITRADNGQDIEEGPIRVENDGYVVDAVGVSGRIGLSAAREAQLRFFLPGSPFVSRGKPAAGSSG